MASSELLLIAGGMEAVGEYHETVQILDSGCLEEAGIRRIGVAGHPEGHPDVAQDLLDVGVGREEPHRP